MKIVVHEVKPKQILIKDFKNTEEFVYILNILRHIPNKYKE